MSLQNAINTPPGEFLKEFEATISNCRFQQAKKPGGKNFWKAKATDGQFSADLICFSQTFEHFEGKRVRFTGRGIQRRDDYNGTAQISIGDKTTWTGVGGGAASQPQQQTAPAPQAGAVDNRLADQSNVVRSPDGQSVGNALTNSTRLAICYSVQDDKLEDFLFETCSIYLRVSQRLMAGELAPSKEDVPY